MYDLFRPIAIFGNIIFILWILLNGINEGFSGTVLAKISYIALLILLALNAILLYRRHRTT